MYKDKVLSIDTYMFLGFFLSFIFFDVDGIEFFFKIKIEYIIVLCMVIAWAIMIPSIRISSLAVAYFLYFGIIAFSTLFNNSNELFALMYYTLRLMTCIMLMDYVIRAKHFNSFFKGVKWFLILMISLTIVFQIFRQDYFGYTISGNYNNFLVSDNYLGFYYISFFMIVYLTSLESSQIVRKTKVIVCIFVCLWSLVCAWSATAMMCVIIYLIGFWGINKIKFLQTKMTFINAILLNVIIFFLLIIVRIHTYFEWLINGILNKSMTLSLRTYIWDSAIENIAKKPFIGYGTCKGQVMQINSWIMNGKIYTFFSHNYFLENMIQGGILAVAALGVIYYMIYRKSREKKILVNEAYNVVALTVFCLLLMSQLGMVLYSPINHLPIIFAYYCKEIMLNNENR